MLSLPRTTALFICWIFLLKSARIASFSIQPRRGSSIGWRTSNCLYMLAEDKDANSRPLFLEIDRRSAVLSIASVATTTQVAAKPAPAAASADNNKIPIRASWKAVAGLNSNDDAFVAFDSTAYQAMVNDPARTPYFERAIIRRLNAAPGGPESQTVLDLGTGPYAVFAIMAARNGAGRVYAMEANGEAARSARATVQKAGYDDIVTVLEGFSTDLSLPNGSKADFCVAEIIGSVATEEGAYATILDAHRRLVKEPTQPGNWIPSRVQTWAAPASYTLHNLFRPPAFDWDKLQGEPVRFNCKDQGLQLLSNPQIVEDIRFADIQPGGFPKVNLRFVVDDDRIEDNISSLVREFREGRLDKDEAERMAKATATSFSGIAMWPRLILDDQGEIQVNSRSHPDGNHQKSHWQSVLPIMNGDPVPVKGGDEIMVTADFEIPESVTKVPTYGLAGNIIRT